MAVGGARSVNQNTFTPVRTNLNQEKKMSKIANFYLEQHKVGCRAVEHTRKGTWSSPWFISGEAVYADKNGGKRGNTTRFFVAVCNSTDCPARKLVKCNDIEVAIR